MYNKSVVHSWIDSINDAVVDLWILGEEGQVFAINSNGSFSIENTDASDFNSTLGIYEWEVNTITWCRCVPNYNRYADRTVLVNCLRKNIGRYLYHDLEPINPEEIPF